MLNLLFNPVFAAAVVMAIFVPTALRILPDYAVAQIPSLFGF